MTLETPAVTLTLREKNLGRRIRACLEAGCRVSSFHAIADTATCPGCGSDGIALNELAHRGVGARP
jgi:hypothetical protein